MTLLEKMNFRVYQALPGLAHGNGHRISIGEVDGKVSGPLCYSGRAPSMMPLIGTSSVHGHVAVHAAA